jgi:hypothetical protein
MAISTSPRATGVCADQFEKAFAAERTARPTSAVRERATRQISLPVTGENFANVSLADDPDSHPSIQFGMV